MVLQRHIRELFRSSSVYKGMDRGAASSEKGVALRIEERIFLIRGLRVMLDRDLGELYGVSTKALNQAVRRNRERFPEEFLVRLTWAELDELVTKCDRFQTLKHSSRPPLAFSEYGVAMLSSVLRSRQAIQINVRIIQAFIRLRGLAAEYAALAARVRALERKAGMHDKEISELVEALDRLAPPEHAPKKRIGFRRG